MKKQILTILGACLLGFSALGNTIYELGTVAPGVPADPTAENTMLIALINAYNAGTPANTPFDVVAGPHTDQGMLNPGSFVPAAPLAMPGDISGNLGLGLGGTSITIALGTGGYSYAMVKWGRDNEFYYIGGLTGDVVLNNDLNQNGESHYDLWKGTPPGVPDGGTTVLLLGAALSGLGLIRRKLS